jgi:hypothetical protein
MNKSYKGLSIILAIIIVFLVVGGIYFYPKSRVPTSKTEVELKTATPTPLTLSMRVISPNGGEVWESGIGGQIKWIDDRDVSNVVIYAINSQTGGTGTNISGNISVRSSGIDGTASYAWNGTGVPPGSYKLNICNTDTKKCDLSDGTFTIMQ